MLKTNDDKFSGNVWGVVGGKALLLPLQRVFATLNKKEIGWAIMKIMEREIIKVIKVNDDKNVK